MIEKNKEEILLYSSNWCAHAVSVEKFLARHDIPVKKISIDGDKDARQELIEINGGYASVPTMIFPDGSKLTEPSFGDIKKKLDFEESSGLVDRVRAILTGDNKDVGPPEGPNALTGG